MQSTPCDIHTYNSEKYNLCVKDIVYEQAQDEWIMLDPRFPNLKGVTPKRIDEFLANAETEEMRDYFEDYLQHVMVYDRDDIVDMCHNLGKQIEEKYPGKLHSPHSIFVTTPRGGHEVLSIFAYTNDLKKEQIPSNIRKITNDEAEIIRRNIEQGETEHTLLGFGEVVKGEEIESGYEHLKEGNYPIIPNIWLNTMSNFFKNKIETVFIIDDVIASGEQIEQIYNKINNFFNRKVEIILIILVKRKDVGKPDYIERKPTSTDEFIMKIYESIYEKILYDTETVGLAEWHMVREIMYDKSFITSKFEEEKQIYDSLITVRFPWGSPDGESDKILTTLYESRRGLERIERKQRRCALEPDK